MSRRYNIPMVGLKDWYKDLLNSVGRIASLEDADLQRMYATEAVSDMNHFILALDERSQNVVNSDKKHEIELMKKKIMNAMNHVKNDYDVTPENLMYKWKLNTSANSLQVQPNNAAFGAMPTNEGGPSSINIRANNNNNKNNNNKNNNNKNNNNNNNENNNIENNERESNSLRVEAGEPLNINNENLKESNVLTLGDLKNYTQLKTGSLKRNTTRGGARRKSKKSRRRHH
jgi:hypothetical protein